MRVLRNLLSSCSVTLICCLIISAAVIGRRGLKGGTVCEIGLTLPPTGDDGNEEITPPPTILLDVDLLISLNPSALFTLLVGFVTT
jgi:hypothetical protein